MCTQGDLTHATNKYNTAKELNGEPKLNTQYSTQMQIQMQINWRMLCICKYSAELNFHFSLLIRCCIHHANFPSKLIIQFAFLGVL